MRELLWEKWHWDGKTNKQTNTYTHKYQLSIGRKQPGKVAQLLIMKYSPVPATEVMKEDVGKRDTVKAESVIIGGNNGLGCHSQDSKLKLY